MSSSALGPTAQRAISHICTCGVSVVPSSALLTASRPTVTPQLKVHLLVVTEAVVNDAAVHAGVQVLMGV